MEQLPQLMDLPANRQSLITYLPEVRGTYRESVLLSKTNWFGVGGPAEVLFRPENTEDLAHFLAKKPLSIAVNIIGVGSNLLVRDGGIEGVVIKLGRAFNTIHVSETYVYAGAGALDYNVALVALEHGLAGLEFLSGIPGTIGGGLAMNAGAYGSDISSVLEYAELLDDQGNLHQLTPKDIGFIYRGHTLPEGWIFTRAVLRAHPDDPAQIQQRMQQIQERREATQPIKTRTSGSTFANPVNGQKAWELIDKAGCRGLRRGGAVVSVKHCNFLINEGDASAADLELLGEEVRQRVFDMSGIWLEWEVKRIGQMKIKE